MHEWSFLYLHPQKRNFFFNSFGFMGFKTFIKQDGKNTIIKILFGTENFKLKINFIKLVSLKILIESYNKLTQ